MTLLLLKLYKIRDLFKDKLYTIKALKEKEREKALIGNTQIQPISKS